MFRRIRRPTTLPVNYESTPLLSSILTPQCLFTSLLFTPALPLLPATPIHLSSRKKTKKKIICQILIAPFCFQSSTRLSLLSYSSYYRLLRFNSPRILSETHLITFSQQSPAFVMGDNATEIDLDSVIDRLLEGAFLFLGSRKHNLWIWESSILYIPRIVGILPMWVDTAWADVPAELHDRLFQVSENLRRSVGCWVVCYPWSYSLSLAVLRNSLFSSDIPILKSSRSCDGCSHCLVQYEEIDLGSLSSSKSTRSNTFAPKPAKFSLINLFCWS